LDQKPPAMGERQSDVQQCNQAQIAEMERFKWFMGEQMGHDPLRDRSINDIYCEWIVQYGAAFRKWWEEKEKRDAERLLAKR